MRLDQKIDPTMGYLQVIFSRLNESKIPYAVMRNYSSLPYSTDGSDLDILVPTDKGYEIEQLLKSAAEEAGGAIIGVARTVGFFKINALGQASESDRAWWGLRVDVSVNLKFKGYANLLSDDILATNRTENFRGIQVLPTDLAAVLGVLKELLYNQIIPTRYLSDARSAFQNNRNQLFCDLAPMGTKAIMVLEAICVDEHEDQKSDRKMRTLRSLVTQEAFFRDPFDCIWNLIQFTNSRISRLVNPPGITITLVGGEISKKNAIIASILPIIESATHGDTLILNPNKTNHFKENRKKIELGEDEANTDTRPPIFKIRNIFIYWLKIRPFIARSPSVVILNTHQKQQTSPSIGKTTASYLDKRSNATIFVEADAINQTEPEKTNHRITYLNNDKIDSNVLPSIIISHETTVSEAKQLVLLLILNTIRNKNAKP